MALTRPRRPAVSEAIQLLKDMLELYLNFLSSKPDGVRNFNALSSGSESMGHNCCKG